MQQLYNMVSLSVVVLNVALRDDDRVAVQKGQVVVSEALKEVLGRVEGGLPCGWKASESVGGMGVGKA